MWPKGLLYLFQVKCHSAALEHFKKELEHATVNCDEEFYIKCTLEALELDCLQQVSTDNVVFPKKNTEI